MQSTNKIFIYVDIKTDTVLHIRQSLKYDYFISSNEIRSYLIKSDLPRPQVKSLEYSFSLQSGFSSTKLSAIDINRCELLKTKVMACLQFSTICAMMIDQINKTFDVSNLLLTSLDGHAQRSYILMATQEKALAINRVHKFSLKLVDDILKSTSQKSIAQLIHHIEQNVNLGVYSATNQERKKLDFSSERTASIYEKS